MIFWVSSLKLCCSVTTLSSSLVHPLSQPVFGQMLIFTDWTEACLSVVCNWFFYICRYILSLTAFPVLWEIFKDFKKIIEAITTNTKVHFNTIEKCKSLLQGLKAFFFFSRKTIWLRIFISPEVILEVRNIIMTRSVWSWHIHTKEEKKKVKIK